MSANDPSPEQETSFPSDQPPLSSNQLHHENSGGHAAHHLKWGDIAVSGFAPPSMNVDEEEADDGLGCRKPTTNKEDRLRKMTRDRSMELLDAEARRIHSNRRYIFRRPRALQYFRGRILVRSEEERGSGRLELFFDLTFVGIIAVLAEEVISDPTGESLVRYLITYTAAYLVWQFMKEVFNAFYKDDLSQRILVLFVMACLVIYGNNAREVQNNLSEGPARAAAVGSYLLAEFAIFATTVFYSFHVKAYRSQIRAHAFSWLFSSAIWIGCIFVDVRSAVAMAVVALAVEYGSWIFCYTVFFKKLLRLRYSSALNIEHEIERFNDFFTLVIGEFLYSIFSGQPAGTGVHIAAGRAVLAVIIAFCFQLFYMQGGGSKQFNHPIRYNWAAGVAYFTLHIPIVSALTLCGDSMADLVREEHVSSGVRWIACEAYAIGMIGIWCLAMLEQERDGKGELWLPKWARLAPRLAIGFIAIFLPLTHQNAPEGEAEASPETSATEAIATLVARAMEGAGEGGSNQVDMTTTKLLAILACLSFFTLLWEQITCLDGPNAIHETAHDDFLDKADDGHTPKAALSTPHWRGFPTLVEPGSGTFDRTHQRDHRLSRTDTEDTQDTL